MPIDNRSTDRQLLEAASRRDLDAFDLFYRRYNKLITAYLRRRVGDPERAADLMAEVFAATLATVVRDGKVPDEPAGWLFTVANNKLIDSARRGATENRARRALQMQPVELDDADLARIDELTDDHRVEQLLETLPADQREAIRARVLDERDYDEIAQELGISNLVLRKRVSRGLATLRSRLEKDPS